MGRFISKEGLLINSKRIKEILAFSLLKTKKQLRGFLGLTEYCSHWVPNFPLISQPLYALLKSDQLDLIEWMPKGKEAINTLKSILTQALGLGHTNYNLLFFLFVIEVKGTALGVLLKSMVINSDP